MLDELDKKQADSMQPSMTSPPQVDEDVVTSKPTQAAEEEDEGHH